MSACSSLYRLLQKAGGYFAVLVITAMHTANGLGQSTFASLVGTVREQGGAVVVGAVLDVENTGTSAHRSGITDQEGTYTVPNLEPGSYKISISSPGLRTTQYTVELLARQTVRIDGLMNVA